MGDRKHPHFQGRSNQTLVGHDRNGSDIEMPVAEHEQGSESHLGTDDEKNIHVSDQERQGDSAAPKQNRKERFRRLIRIYRPVIHIFIWMLITTQVAPQPRSWKC